MYDSKSHGRRYECDRRQRALDVLRATRDVGKAAQASGAAKRTVRRWAREAGIPPVRTGGSVTNLDRRAFMHLLAGQAAMVAAAPAAAARALTRARAEPTGVVRAYFAPAGVFSGLAIGDLSWPAARDARTEPVQVMDAVRGAFERDEVYRPPVDWGSFRPPSAGLVVVNDTPHEVEIGWTLWSTGHVQFHADGAPVELDLLTQEKAHALGLQLR